MLGVSLLILRGLHRWEGNCGSAERLEWQNRSAHIALFGCWQTMGDCYKRCGLSWKSSFMFLKGMIARACQATILCSAFTHSTCPAAPKRFLLPTITKLQFENNFLCQYSQFPVLIVLFGFLFYQPELYFNSTVSSIPLLCQRPRFSDPAILIRILYQRHEIRL